MIKEQQLKANAEQLQNKITTRNTRVLALRDDEQDALVRLTELQQAEAEQVLRLETLQAGEQRRQSQIVALEQRGANSREEIRLNLLGSSENGKACDASQDGDVPLLN